EGNPLVLLETLRTLLESGELNLEPVDSETGGKPPILPIPRQVQDLIRMRLTALSEEQRRVLNAAAVIGRPCSLHLLRQISGLPELQLLDRIEHLLACSFLEEKNDAMPQGLLVFQHNYYRQVIYQDLRAMQQQLLHRRVAEALLAGHKIRPETIIEEVAYHFEQAGDPQAVTYLAQAAQQAEALFALDHAAALYSRALIFQERYLDLDRNGRFDLLLAREAVLARQGRRAEQSGDVTSLIKLADSLGDPERQALACLRQVELFVYTGQHPEARRVGEQALVIYRQIGNKKGQAQTLREFGFLHWTTGDYGAALTYNRDALQLHRQLGDIEGEATALHNLAEIYRGLGSPRQALTQYELALNLHWAQQERRRQGLTLYGMAHTLRQIGQNDEALVRYEQALTHCQAAGDRLMTSRVQHTLAGLYWEMGVLEQAVAYMQQALTISREIGYGSGIAHGLIALSYLGMQQENLALAHQYLTEAITWLKLIEDQPGVAEAQARLATLETGFLDPMAPPVTLGWVKDNVVLAEGKIYCEFESPMAQRKA
ncbi:MAG: tetratricopeptide repeat protein, partial [Caldilineaceae bacterium]